MSPDIRAPLSDAETARVTVMLPLATKERLNEIAHDESSPERRVTMSDVARTALAEYVESYEAGGDE